MGQYDVICGLSGGVDSSVAAVLMQKAIGDQLTCIYIDTGFMRKGETKSIIKEKVKKETKPAKTVKPSTEAKAKKPAPTKEKKAAVKVVDDLKQLSGVGPALEKKLHAAGVKSFEQIAAWTAKDAEEINEKISSKGRVEKEGWIDQAKEKLKG